MQQSEEGQKRGASPRLGDDAKWQPGDARSSPIDMTLFAEPTSLRMDTIPGIDPGPLDPVPGTDEPPFNPNPAPDPDPDPTAPVTGIPGLDPGYPAPGYARSL